MVLNSKRDLQTHLKLQAIMRFDRPLYYLAHWANLPEGVYILLALISSFLFFNDRSENNYLRIRWTDFRNLFTI